MKFLPTRLGHTWYFATQSALAKANSAQAELPQESAGSTAYPTTIVALHRKLGCPIWQLMIF
jgi:hypothetical protein